MRKGIATKRLTDSEDVTADVELDYEYGDLSQIPPSAQFGEAQPGTQLAVPEPLPVEQPQVQPSSPLVALKTASYRQTPIAQAFLRSMGVS